MFACVPNPGKQSIWRQRPPSARKQSTKIMPHRPVFTHVQPLTCGRQSRYLGWTESVPLPRKLVLQSGPPATVLRKSECLKGALAKRGLLGAVLLLWKAVKGLQHSRQQSPVSQHSSFPALSLALFGDEGFLSPVEAAPIARTASPNIMDKCKP